MAIFDYLSIIDTYGVSAKLYFGSKTNYKNYLTLTFSIITYILFFVILYFEQEDFLYHTNPNISYIKQNSDSYKDSLKLERNFLPIYFRASIGSEKFNEKIFEHLEISSVFHLTTYKQSTSEFYHYKLKIEECSMEDYTFFKEKNLTTEADETSSKYYCLKGINYDELAKLDFDNLSFGYIVKLHKCFDYENRQCNFNEEFNNLIEKDLVINMYYFSSEIDLNDYSSPFKHKLMKQALYQYHEVTLRPFEIIDQGDSLLTKETKRTELSIYKKNKAVLFWLG
jgi:hypothetical protein